MARNVISKEFEKAVEEFLIGCGHEKIKKRTFKLKTLPHDLEFFLFPHIETGRYYSGYFSADVGIRHPLSVQFSWYGLVKFAPESNQSKHGNPDEICNIGFSTAQIPGGEPALFNPQANFDGELARFKFVLREVCLAEFEKIENSKRFYEMLIYRGEDEWYGNEIPVEASSRSGAVVALGRLWGVDENRILEDLRDVLRVFPAGNVGRMNPKMDGETYVRTMCREWDDFYKKLKN